MKKGYDIMFPTFEDMAKIEKEYNRARKVYLDKGYREPIQTPQLITDMYSWQAKKEAEAYNRQGRELPDDCEIRIEALRTLTLTKMYNELTKTFDNDPNGSFDLNFVNGKPDEATFDFLNLTDQTGGAVNITRAYNLRLPDGFCFGGTPKQMSFSVFKDGEQCSYERGGKEVVSDNFEPNPEA